MSVILHLCTCTIAGSAQNEQDLKLVCFFLYLVKPRPLSTIGILSGDICFVRAHPSSHSEQEISGEELPPAKRERVYARLKGVQVQCLVFFHCVTYLSFETCRVLPTTTSSPFALETGVLFPAFSLASTLLRVLEYFWMGGLNSAVCRIMDCLAACTERVSVRIAASGA